MANLSARSRRTTALTGRRAECDVLDRLIEAVGAGESRALVVRGEPGIGKTALLEYVVEGLSDVDAYALVDSILTAPLDPSVREQIVSETHGIPLAILELLRDLPPAEIAGGFGFAGGTPVSVNVEETYRHRIDAL